MPKGFRGEILIFCQGQLAHEIFSPQKLPTIRYRKCTCGVLFIGNLRPVQRSPIVVLVPCVQVFSKNVHDDSLPVSIQTMSCKLILNLVECIRLKAEQDPSVSGRGRGIIVRD